jgi:hypothetical protein
MARIYIPSEGEVEFLDDLDFMTPARTIRFSLDGVHYEVDLSEKHVQEMHVLLKEFISVSHVLRRDNS